jgi:hypothetical protein
MFHKLLNPPFQMRRVFAEAMLASRRKGEVKDDESALRKRWP